MDDPGDGPGAPGSAARYVTLDRPAVGIHLDPRCDLVSLDRLTCRLTGPGTVQLLVTPLPGATTTLTAVLPPGDDRSTVRLGLTLASGPRRAAVQDGRMTLSRTIARPMLASMFVVGGVNALRNADKLAVRAKPVTDRVAPFLKPSPLPVPSDPATLVRLNGAVHVAAGLALATGRAPRLSSAVLAATLVPTTARRPPVLGGAGPDGPHRSSGSTSSRTSRCSAAC